jgi:L-iditol 2-dehydrogenase
MTERTTTAVVLTEGVTSLRPLPLRALAAGEALLRIRASGLCGTDLFKVRHAQGPPQVLGHEIVGEVIERGRGCRFDHGDLVVAAHHVACGECRRCRSGSETTCEEFRQNLLEPGGFCTHAILKRRAVDHASYVLGDTLDPLSAVFLEPTACVLRGIERSGIEHRGLSLDPPLPDSTRVVVQGAGSMGLLHLLVLRALGLHVEIDVVDPDPGRRALAIELGADRAFAPAVPTGPRSLDGPRPDELPIARADIVFDTAGGGPALAQALSLARPGGTVVLFAHNPNDDGVMLPVNELFRGEQRLISTYSGSAREQGLAFELLSSRILDPRPLVTHELPLDAFDQAVRMCAKRQALKVVFRPHLEAAPGRVVSAEGA